jgi:cobalt-zinc-cadmium efflux system protein
LAHVHDPGHGRSPDQRPLAIALAITAIMLLVEAAGGFLSRSLALIADAGHMLTDVAALGLGLFAFWLSARPASSRRTFGWRRFEIFAAFVNGVALWLIAAVIGYEAFLRIRSPQPVKGALMLAVAAFGLLANIAVAAILFRGRRHNLNIRGAFLHVVADAVGSVGVLIAALLIALTGAFIWDPIVSAVVCLLILWSSARLIRDSFCTFMEDAPSHLDVEAIRSTLASLDGVIDVHDLHVWTITSGFVSLSAHLKARSGADADDLLRRAYEAISSRYKVLHSTFQVETADEPACATGSCDDRPPTSS